MKKSYLWPIELIVCGVLMILLGLASNLGWIDTPLYKIVLAVPLLALTIGKGIIRRKYYILPLTLSSLFMLFEKNIAELASAKTDNLIPNWVVIVAAVCMCIGIALIMVLSKEDRVKVNDKKDSVNLSAVVRYIDCNGFTNEHVECNIGSCRVFFSNVSEFTGNGTLNVYNNMGSILISVPKSWTVISEIENHMGSLSIDTNTQGEADKILKITGENNMGAIHVKFS